MTTLKNEREAIVETVVEDTVAQMHLWQENERTVREFSNNIRDDLRTALLSHEEKVVARVAEDVVKMADALELECGKDGDKGTAQWMAFKGFRNTIRDKYLTLPITDEKHE